MPFTIPSNDVAGVPARQSVWYDTDIAILVAGTAGTGVLTGCAVTAQGTPDMTVAIAAGTVQPTATSTPVTVTAGNVNITAADSTNPRIDLVSASASGTKTVTDGTAAAAPKPPALPSGHIALAMVDVPASDTTISTGQITDKRVVVVAYVAPGGVRPVPVSFASQACGQGGNNVTVPQGSSTGIFLIVTVGNAYVSAITLTNVTLTQIGYATYGGVKVDIYKGVPSGTPGTTLSIQTGDWFAVSVAQFEGLSGTAGTLVSAGAGTRHGAVSATVPAGDIAVVGVAASGNVGAMLGVDAPFIHGMTNYGLGSTAYASGDGQSMTAVTYNTTGDHVICILPVT